MSETLLYFDAEASQDAATEGMMRSDSGSPQWWKERADELIRHLAETCDEFTPDDVWKAGLPENPTGSNTSLGARMRRAQAQGLIFKTGRTVPTERVSAHRRHANVWLSMLRFTGDTIECDTCSGTGRKRVR